MFLLTQTTKSRCPKGHRLVLLMRESGTKPAFYVCWECRSVTWLGHGPLILGVSK